MNDRLYLSIDSDKIWSANFADHAPSADAAPFVKEGSYPVELFFARTDVNGSRIVEMDTCNNREALLESLNWCGKCGYSLLELWDFDIDKDKPGYDEALHVINQGVINRFAKIEKELSAMEMEDDMPEKKLAKISVYQNTAEDFSRFVDHVKFWSNAVCEFYDPNRSKGENQIYKPELSPELQEAVEDLYFDSYEGKFGSYCYLVETPSGFGIALSNEYDTCFAKDCGLDMDQLLQSAVMDAKALSVLPEFAKAEFVVSDRLGESMTEPCHELLTIFPADISQKEFFTAAAKLDELVYDSARTMDPSVFDQNVIEEELHKVTKIIGGKECDCYEVGNTGKMRLELDGTFGEGLDRHSLILVPMVLEEREIEEIADRWLTEQEKDLGLPEGESCTSSGWWVGSKDASRDSELTNQYDFLVFSVVPDKMKTAELEHMIQSAKDRTSQKDANTKAKGRGTEFPF